MGILCQFLIGSENFIEMENFKPPIIAHDG